MSHSSIMVLPFEKKVILITGAGSGIGRATSIKLSTLGALLVLTDINPTSLLETQSLYISPSLHFTSAFDISITSQCNEFISSTISKYGQINHIFNCAGINPSKIPTENITDSLLGQVSKHQPQRRIQRNPRLDPIS